MKSRLRLISAIASALVLAALCSCSSRKNTAATRNYQAFITRYNVYFNGDEHYRETLHDMEQNYEDDYTALLPVHPAQMRGIEHAPQPSGNFDRSIEKAQKAIQLHSIKKRPAKKAGKSSDPAYKAWMKRDEYNPFLHNAWMMMGRSQYMNGDFLGAATTFYYVSRHFSWLTTTVTEAQLWQARSYVAMNWLFEAETILRRIKQADITSTTLQNLYNNVQADLLVKSNDYAAAVPYLQAAAKSAKGSQRSRLWFLLGQVNTRLGNKAAAYEAYRRAGSSPSASYRTKFNARIHQSEVYTGADIRPEVKALKRMTRYDRNKEYLDQIYYAIGNLYMSRRDTTAAISNYILAAKNSTRNGIDKAISQLRLGTIYFDQGRYDLAQPCYSEAIPQLPDNYPGIDTLRRRSDVLDELAVYANNVTLQDSLLRLSNMTEDERFKVIDKIIADLNKREKEEAEAAQREEYLAQQAAAGTQQSSKNNSTTPVSYSLNTDDSWYFYNTATLNAGRSDFQKRWGSRKLEDDWRRRNKSAFSFSDFEESADAENADDNEQQHDSSTPTDKGKASDSDKNGASDHISDPHFREYYLAQIPFTDQERLNANDIIQEGLFNMGSILKDKLEDYIAARSEWDKLLERYPDNIYRLDVYYNLYLMYMRQGRTAEAERWRQLILSDFAESKYGMALADPKYIDNLREMPQRQQQMYDDAYAAYLANDNATVHAAYQTMMDRYPLSTIMPKFMFIHALAYVTENRPEQFNATLRELLERYPDTDITPLASSYLSQMAKGRELHSGATNTRGMVWDTRLSNDTTATDGFAADTPLEFNLSPEIPQLLILLYPTTEVNGNQLLYEVARHNFSSFVVKDFDLEQMNFGQLGLLIIKGFANIEELNHYRAVLDADSRLILPEQVRPVVIAADNFRLLLSQGRSFEEYFNYVSQQSLQQTHASVLPPDEFASEAEERQALNPDNTDSNQ
jgi:tetratricopeptide (TPR) repeat protein